MTALLRNSSEGDKDRLSREGKAGCRHFYVLCIWYVKAAAFQVVRLVGRMRKDL